MFSISRLSDAACMSHSLISALLATEDFYSSSLFSEPRWRIGGLLLGHLQHYVCQIEDVTNLAGTFSNRAEAENLFLRFDINKCFFLSVKSMKWINAKFRNISKKKGRILLSNRFFKNGKIISYKKSWVDSSDYISFNSFLSNIWKRDILKKLIP